MDNRMLIGFSLPQSVDKIVTALCADFERRAEIISDRSGSLRLEIECRHLNYKITEAANEVVGERLAPYYIKEIGEKKGFAKTDVSCVSESTYKINKREIKSSIARKLHLID